MRPGPTASTSPDAEREREAFAMKGSVELRAFIDGFLGSVPGAVIVLDERWRLVYLNHDARKFFLDTDESLLGRPLEEIYPRQFGRLLAPQMIQGLLEGNENTVTKYVNPFRKWYKISAYSSDSGIFIRLEDITLEKVANRLRTMNQFSVDRAADMIFWLKPSGHIIYANTASCKSLGFERRELTSMMVTDIDPSFMDNKWPAFVNDLKTRESMVYESSLLTRDRSIILVEVTCNFLIFYGEEYLIVSARDITERKRAEGALRDSEEKYRTLVEMASEGIWISDTDGRTTFVNKRMAEMIGYSPEEMIGKLAFDFMDKDANAIGRRNLERRRQGIKESFEQKFIRKDGTVLWAIVSGTPLLDKDGSVNAFMGMLTDITKRKQAEEALRESEEKFRKFFDFPLIGAAITSRDKRFIQVNDKLCEMFGYSREELLQTSWDKITYPEDMARNIDAFNRLMSGGIETYTFEKRFIHKNGSIVYVILSVQCIRRKDGTVDYFISNYNDITKRKQGEIDLREAKDQAEIYLDLMGHDINNLNQVAIGYLELANEKLKDDEIKELISKPLDAITRSSNLIENVRKLQKSRTYGLTIEAVDLNEVLSELKTQYSKIVGKEVNIELTSSPKAFIMANGLIKDVFSNLIDNAIKHSNTAKPININIRLERTTRKDIQVAIEDNGPGITDEMKVKLFTRFQRGNTKATGKGLGLYLVKTLLEDFHGRVWAEDRVQGDYTRGSRFVVMLPAAEK